MHTDPGNEVLVTTTFETDVAPWVQWLRDAGGLEADVGTGGACFILPWGTKP